MKDLKEKVFTENVENTAVDDNRKEVFNPLKQ